MTSDPDLHIGEVAEGCIKAVSGIFLLTIIGIVVWNIFDWRRDSCANAYGLEYKYLKTSDGIIHCGNGKGEIKKI